MKNKIYSILIFLCAFNVANAQRISMDLDYGVASGFKYQFNNTESAREYGLGFGVNFSNPITAKLFVETGISYNQYNTSLTLKEDFNSITNEIDAFERAFEMRQTVMGYSDDQKLHTITVPLLLTFKQPLSSRYAISASAGIKYMIPLSMESKMSAEKVTVKGYYPNWDLEIDDLNSAGFGTVSNVSDSNNNKVVKNTFLFGSQLGVEFNVQEYKLYLGGYFDLTLSDLRKDNYSSEVLVPYTKESLPGQLQSTLEQKNIKKLDLMSLGVKLRIPLVM